MKRINRMVKKCIHALFHRAAPKMRFPACFIFNDLRKVKGDVLIFHFFLVTKGCGGWMRPLLYAFIWVVKC